MDSVGGGGAADASGVMDDVWSAIRIRGFVATRVKETGSGPVEVLGPNECLSLETYNSRGADAVGALHLLATAGLLSSTEYVHPFSSNEYIVLYRRVTTAFRARMRQGRVPAAGRVLDGEGRAAALSQVAAPYEEGGRLR